MKARIHWVAGWSVAILLVAASDQFGAKCKVGVPSGFVHPSRTKDGNEMGRDDKVVQCMGNRNRHIRRVVQNPMPKMTPVSTE